MITDNVGEEFDKIIADLEQPKANYKAIPRLASSEPEEKTDWRIFLAAIETPHLNDFDSLNRTFLLSERLQEALHTKLPYQPKLNLYAYLEDKAAGSRMREDVPHEVEETGSFKGDTVGYPLVYRIFWIFISMMGLIWGGFVGASLASTGFLGIGTVVTGTLAWGTLVLTLTVAGRITQTRQ